MRCPKCGGTGWDVVHRFDCISCDGTGEIALTNEEWFCQLPTTEKSEFLVAMVKEAIEVYEKHGTTWHEAVSWWNGWLKGEHRD